MDRAERDVDRVELIVARRRRDHPARGRHHTDHAERLIPDGDVTADRVLVAEHALGRHAAEHHDLLRLRLLAGAEEPAAAERPRAANQRQTHVRAVEAREPAAVAGFDVDVLVQTLGHVLHAADAANRLGVRRRQRGRRAEAGLAVAEPLTRGRVIVFLHRVVFGMRKQRRRDK